jgi:hypothetical protein
MAAVGDRVQVPSKRVGQAPRDGVVTGVSGSLLRVTWSGGEESTIFPSMGSLVVVGKVRARITKSASTPKAPTKQAPKVTAKKTAPSSSKKAAKRSATKTAKVSGKAKHTRVAKVGAKSSGKANKRRK